MTLLDYATVAEEALVALAARGDDRAFDAVVQRRQGWLRGLLRRMCDDADLADDLAQSTFLKAWRELPRLRSTNAFAAWLRQIAVNTWLQHARRHSPLRDPLKDPLADPETGEDEQGVTAATASAALDRDLQAALGTLAAPVRLCVVLAYHEGMSHNEIASLTQLPLGTVKSHILRGTKALREYLGAYRDAGVGVAKNRKNQGIEHD
ncbi:MAG: sigma-70 family RNA polymerase sigma factor [Pseudomonadota bacterium]